MYKNRVTTWTNDDTLDAIYEKLRRQHYIKSGHRLYKNYSSKHINEVSAKSIYWGHSGEPEIVASILSRPCWPENTYRILNRLWKPALLTNPIFDISEGFSKLIEDQISWCELRGAEGFFMSRQGNTAWRQWAVAKFKEQTDLEFYLPDEKFLTCNDESDDSCWQNIIYVGNKEKLSQWKNIPPPIKQGLYRLDMNDFANLKDLVSTKSSIKAVIADDMSYILQYRARWAEGMQKHYLNPESKTHYMYGWYENDVLVSCMGWRCDLPAPWNDGWVVGNLKSRPGYTVKTNGMLQIWKKMFEICEGKGLKKWHMVIPEGNSRRYQAVADRYFSDIDTSYDYEWSIIVPPETEPEIDWVWGSMGRVKLNTEIRVRTGTKKWEYLVPYTFNWNKDETTINI
jgi:hypothetical protein